MKSEGTIKEFNFADNLGTIEADDGRVVRFSARAWSGVDAPRPAAGMRVRFRDLTPGPRDTLRAQRVTPIGDFRRQRVQSLAASLAGLGMPMSEGDLTALLDEDTRALRRASGHGKRTRRAALLATWLDRLGPPVRLPEQARPLVLQELTLLKRAMARRLPGFRLVKRGAQVIARVGEETVLTLEGARASGGILRALDGVLKARGIDASWRETDEGLWLLGPANVFRALELLEVDLECRDAWLAALPPRSFHALRLYASQPDLEITLVYPDLDPIRRQLETSFGRGGGPEERFLVAENLCLFETMTLVTVIDGRVTGSFDLGEHATVAGTRRTFDRDTRTDPSRTPSGEVHVRWDRVARAAGELTGRLLAAHEVALCELPGSEKGPELLTHGTLWRESP